MVPYFDLIMKFYIVIFIVLCALIAIIYKKRENKLKEISDCLKRIEDKIDKI